MNPDKSVTLLGLGGGAGAKTGLYCLPVTMQVRCGNPVGGGKGALLQYDKSATLNTCQGLQQLFVPKVFKIAPYHSNAMLSGNPDSGIYETDKSNTLSTNGADPCCNQCDLLICVPTYGMDRASYNMGKNAQYGMVITEDKAPTMVAKGPGAVFVPEVYTTAKARFMAEVTTDKAYTLVSSDYKDAPVVYVPVGEFEEITEEEYKAAVEDEKEFVFPVWGSSRNYFFTKAFEDKADTLLARDWKDAPIVYVPKAFETVCIEGNGSRPSHKGDGYAVTDKMYTLNTVEKHAVAYVRFIPEYEIRRLTPKEEGRLQGYPEGWTEGLAVTDPTEAEMEFWKGVFQTHWELGIAGTKKPKTEKEIRKWLADEPNDQALYKMWGNGIALPPFQYVLEGIKEVLEREE